MENFYFELFVGLVIAVAVFCAFDLGLNLADAAFTNFKGSTLHSGIFALGWLCFILSIIFGGSYIGNLLKACFPAVQFHGHFADPGTPTRTRLFWVAGALVLPILLNLVTSKVSNLLKWFSPE